MEENIIYTIMESHFYFPGVYYNPIAVAGKALLTVIVIVIVIPSFCWEIKPSAKFERQWLRLNHWGEKHL